MTLKEPRPSFGQHVTPGEIRVLRAYLDAGSSKEAAHQLGIHEQTVKNHLWNIRIKLGVPSTAAAVYALYHRLAA